jgi:alkaline phosphatase
LIQQLSERSRYLLAVLLVALAALALSGASTAEAQNRGGPQGGPVPENIIVMISDGMGYNQVDVTSMWQYGKSRYQRIDGGHPQRVPSQVYQRFPVQYPMETTYIFGEYDPERAWTEFDYVTNLVTDSAAAATAMSTGVKTRRWIGLDRDGNRLTHSIQAAQALDKATGVVSTNVWTHATPAGFSAYSEDRRDYDTIARSMVLDSGLDVIMGTGHPWYDNDGRRVETPNYSFVGGQELWDGLQSGDTGNPEIDSWTTIETLEEFRALAAGEGPLPDRVLGTAEVLGTLQYNRSGDRNAPPFTDPLNDNVPTLAEMSRAALNVLDNASDEGFYVMLEGGAVDYAGHDNALGGLIEEQVDFNLAVEEVVDWVERESSWRETLVIVTSDHETGYLLGPGSDPERKPVVNNGRGNMPGVSWHSDYHTNQLVPFYAKGAGANRFRSYATEKDPVLGRYIDLTNIAHVTFDLWGRPAAG